jgi:hypothetical protein
MKRCSRAAAIGLGVVALGALGVGAAVAEKAGPAAVSATTATTSTTGTTKVEKPEQQTIKGSVTKASTKGHSFVIDGKTVFVSSKTTYHRIHGGLSGIKTSRRYTVSVSTSNGKYYTTSVKRR